MNLEECLIEYKSIILDIMERVNLDGSIGHLVDEREKLLHYISKLEFSQEEIMEICISLRLMELEHDLKTLIQKEKVNCKKKIEDLKRMRTANMKYMTLSYVPSRFNKKS